jgi:trehalose 6-phosphate phosphatase
MSVSSRLADLAKRGPTAIYTDIDGTLSHIAPTPDMAKLADGAGAALRTIAASGIRIVAISGRAAADARGMVGLTEIDYAGNHGFELLTPNGPVIRDEVVQAASAVQQALAEVTNALPDLPTGTIVENKTFTGSVHYRLTADPVAAIAELRPLVMEIANRHELVVTEGRMVLEIRPPLHIDKGVFIRNDVSAHGIKSAAFLGDDLTDVDGFIALQALRSSGQLERALAVAVTSLETPPSVIRESDLQVEGVQNLVGELQAFAEMRSIP